MAILMKVEVAKKQAYIFSSNLLKDNITRSNHITYVTGSEYFENVASEVYREAENLVYSGGGHAVLRFATKEQARAFTKIITTYAFTRYDGLELFCKHMEYDEKASPQENLMNLSKQLEEKKALRKDSFGQISLGIEKLNSVTYQLEDLNKVKEKEVEFEAFSEYTFPKNFSKLVEDENFLAVIHIDGNAMGKRVDGIYQDKDAVNFDKLAQNIRKFSKSIQNDFEFAFECMLERISNAEKKEGIKQVIPIRPIILAGDDVCFVTKGSIGLECARIFLEELTQIANEQDRLKYAACAGVAIVHTKFPFYKAYNLAEELCSNAKKFGATYHSDGSISSIDWHVEYGQLKVHLPDIRKEYICEDENILTLRPMVVVNANSKNEISIFKQYDYFKRLCTAFQTQKNQINLGKLKQMRNALRQGEIETAYFIRSKEISDVIFDIIESTYGSETARVLVEAANRGEVIERNIFQWIDTKEGKKKYCLCFDAIEMMDVYAEIVED
ncbi:MAG: hypothetical protein R3Y24_05255 [Eubacteriales bacterium]